jgi:cytochrome c-type biogenesis protein CcmE
MSRTRIIIGGVLVAAFVYLGLGAFKDTLTPYVSFSEARAAVGKNVQVTGGLGADRRWWYSDDAERRFCFLMMEEDSGDTLEVSFPGVKPATFEEAVSVGAVGRFDGRRFQASQVLTKCPSKYQGKDAARHESAMGRSPGRGGAPQP